MAMEKCAVEVRIEAELNEVLDALRKVNPTAEIVAKAANIISDNFGLILVRETDKVCEFKTCYTYVETKGDMKVNVRTVSTVFSDGGTSSHNVAGFVVMGDIGGGMKFSEIGRDEHGHARFTYRDANGVHEFLSPNVASDDPIISMEAEV